MIGRRPRLIEGTKELEEKEMLQILEEGEYGIISTIGEEGMPYGFPMSYIIKDKFIYFHCGLAGHKINNFKYNNKVSFCVVGRTKLIPEDLDTGYESVIVFGEIEEVKDRDKKIEILMDIVEKYAKDYMKEGLEESKRDADVTGIFRISMDEITGKVRRI